jgi:tetratricopeptide (TPR) repeat protein
VNRGAAGRPPRAFVSRSAAERAARLTPFFNSLLAALFAGWVAAAGQEAPEPPAEAAIEGDCSNDPEALIAEAEVLLEEAGPLSREDALDWARRLYRRARLLQPSAWLSLRSADLAAAAGEEEEAVDLLSEAAESGGELLSPLERLLLARRAEARRQWQDAIRFYRDLGRALGSEGAPPSWIAERLRRLEVEAEAQALSAPVAPAPSPEARLALGEGKRALASGRMPEARERLRLALRLSPGYVEAALLLGALEAREGRASEAIRSYRNALAAEPGRFEALVALANLLWDEPDREAKRESLDLLDRAAEIRPDLRSLLKTSSTRWAEWGDAAQALERLDAYRRGATAEERQSSEALRRSLATRVERGSAGGEPAAPVGPMGEGSPAVEQWKIAQVYFRRGDEASLSAALDHLEEAERLDPGFGRAAELAGTIYEKRGELREAEAAFRRAILADPSRASSWERIASLLSRQPGRSREAEEAWRSAEQAGSTEALFSLALLARNAGRSGEAASLHRRYLNESPGGVHAEEAASVLSELDRRRRLLLGVAGGAIGLLLLAGAWAVWSRASGSSFEEWLARRPEATHEARPVVGRLRHEVVKHGGLLLSDAAARLREPNPAARRETAELLLARLFGWGEEGAGRGLLDESRRALRDLRAIALRTRDRLNLSSRDPLFSPLLRGLRVLDRLQRPLRRIASGRATRALAARVASRLDGAAESFQAPIGPALERLLDAASATEVRFEALAGLLGRLAAEKRLAYAPSLEPLGLFRDEPGRPLLVRVGPSDWETIWRNLFANALEAGGNGRSTERRLALGAERSRDGVTGAPLARFVLADDAVAPLTTDMIRGRAVNRGWGIVADLVRRHGGAVEVGPPPASGYVKGVVLELPALEFS